MIKQRVIYCSNIWNILIRMMLGLKEVKNLLESLYDRNFL